jgi:hypothetical protein
MTAVAQIFCLTRAGGYPESLLQIRLSNLNRPWLFNQSSVYKAMQNAGYET